MQTDVQEKRPLMVEMDIKVRTYDIDSLGHVSNIVYLRWCEDMRLEIFDNNFPLSELMELGYAPVIASTNIEYKRAVKISDRPRGYMWISSVGNASFTFSGEILVDGQIATRVKHTGVFVDLQTMRPKKMPDLFLHKYQKALAE